ncbi:MAG: type IV toxin-antitoxin system AbiEi family antitoxin, partial [Patescibacteria group bacterium]
MTYNIKKSKNLYKILGPVSSRLVTELSQSKKTVFSLSEAVQILRTDNKQAKKLLHDLVKKGWLKRIEKGKYFLIPLTADATKPYTENQFLIASKLVDPYYIGFWSMLHYYGYTEQLINTIFVVSPKRRKNLSISDINYKFVKTTPEKMFGLIKIEINSMPIKVSDKEKTLLDCLDHPEYCGGITEVAKGIWNARDEVDFMKILGYANKMSNSAVAKRLGYLIEILELDKKFDTKVLKKI